MTDMTIEDIAKKLDYLRRCSSPFYGRGGLANRLLMGKVDVEDAGRELKAFDCKTERKCTVDVLNPSSCVARGCDVWTLRNLVTEHSEVLRMIGRSGRRGAYKDLGYVETRTEKSEGRILSSVLRPITYS
jgi:hypothetical protein